MTPFMTCSEKEHIFLSIHAQIKEQWVEDFGDLPPIDLWNNFYSGDENDDDDDDGDGEGFPCSNTCISNDRPGKDSTHLFSFSFFYYNHFSATKASQLN